MNKKEAYKILTDNNQNVLDSINPLQFNKKWLEAYHIAINNLNENRKEVKKDESNDKSTNERKDK